MGQFAPDLLASFQGNSSEFHMFLGSLIAFAGINKEGERGSNGLGALPNAILSSLVKTIL